MACYTSVTLTFYLLNLAWSTVNACPTPALDYISTYFGVDSSSRFPFTAWTDKQTDTRSQTPLITLPTRLSPAYVTTYITRNIWKIVGPIRHCEPPHALILHCHSPGVATVARRLRIDVHETTKTTTTTTTTRDRGDRYGPIEWAQLIVHITNLT